MAINIACPRCNKALPDSAYYCPGCGTACNPTLLDANTGEGEQEAEESRLRHRSLDGGFTLLDFGVRLPLESALASNTIFSQLPSNTHQELALYCFQRRYSPEDWVTIEGHVGERAFLVASGRAQVVVSAGRGRRVLVRTLGAGDFFGEPFAITGKERSVSVQAITPLETYVFPQAVLSDLYLAYPVFGQELIRYCEASSQEAFLRRASPFAPLRPDVLLTLASAMESVLYHADDTIFVEGDPGDAVYLVKTGGVDVLIGGHHVASLRVGDIFGEAALLTRESRTATVRVRGSSELLRLNRAAFQRVLAEHQEVQEFFTELLKRRELLTPTMEHPVIHPTDGVSSRASEIHIDYRPMVFSSVLWLGAAVLLALLAGTPRGGLLMFPAVAMALGIAPLAYCVLLHVLGLTGLVLLRRQVLLLGLGLVLGLGLELVLVQVSGWGLELAAEVGRSVASAVALTGAITLAGGKRGYDLEMDGLITGASTGLGFGILSALTYWTASGDLSTANWYILVILPALNALLGAILV